MSAPALPKAATQEIAVVSPYATRDKIIAANPIVDFVRERGYELKPARKNFVTGACPVSQKHTKPGHRPVMIYPPNSSWYCHDCKRGGSVIDWVMHERGCDADEAMRLLGGGNNGAGEIVATYDYTDETGALLFQCVRFQPKDFRQRQPDGKGGWIWNIEGVRRVLYRLAEVIPERTVCVAEGEKDADHLRSLGFTATTNPMGAGKWRPEYAETLRGKDVVIFGDVGDEDGAGEKHTAQVIQSLPDVAGSIKHVKLPDGFHDVSDYIASLPKESAAETIRELIEQTPHVDVESLGKAQAEQWQEPQTLPADMPAVPRFSFESLPDTLRPWIEDISERMQCPPDFPAVGAIIALGSLVGRKLGIRPKRHDDWMEIPNLWGCVVGRPGLLKTPALQQALVPLRRLVAEALKRYENESREHEIDELLTAQRKKLVEDEIKKDLKDGKKGTAREKAGKHIDEAREQPVCRRYEVNDATIEKLGELLAENPTGIVLVRDELSGLLRVLDHEDRAGDRAKYLEMWDGKGELTYDRIGRGTVRIPSNTLSILGGIQPDVHMAYVREAVHGGTGNDGLLQRFQLSVWPDVSKEWRNVDRWPDTKAKNKAFEVFQYLDNLTAEAVGADTSDGIPFLRFDNEAQDRFDAWRAELEKKLRSDTEHPAFEAHLAKYRKLVPALALLIHLADRQKGPVSLDALNKALLWATYLESHARRIYSAVLRPDTAAARELAKHLQRGDLMQRFTLREIYRKGWAGLNSKEDAEAATEILCDLNWIQEVGTPARSPRAPGRGAGPTFEINPKILQHAPEPTDKTDKIDSVGSVSDQSGMSENFSADTEAEVDAFVPEQTATGKLRL
jgi:putative DNA primase/helicase